MTLISLSTSRRGTTRLGSSDVTVTNPVNAAAATNLFQTEGFRNKIFYFRSTLNQTVAITLRSYKSYDTTDTGNVPRTIGAVINLAAGNVTPQTDEVHISDYHPFIDVQYDPGADSTGTLVISFRGQSGE